MFSVVTPIPNYNCFYCCIFGLIRVRIRVRVSGVGAVPPPPS